MALSTCPTSRLTKIPPQLFRVVLLRRLGLPLPLTARSCRCGRPLDSCGHHRAACARASVLAGRGWALKSAVARVCREAGGRVTTNVMIRDLDLIQPGMVDAWRLEVVVDGLLLFGGNWQWMPPSCAPSIPTAPPDGELIGLTAWRGSTSKEGAHAP